MRHGTGLDYERKFPGHAERDQRSRVRSSPEADGISEKLLHRHLPDPNRKSNAQRRIADWTLMHRYLYLLRSLLFFASAERKREDLSGRSASDAGSFRRLQVPLC